MLQGMFNFWISSVNSCWRRVGSTGQEFSLCVRNWGPLNHLLFTFISSIEIPLLASSAGFSSEPTCLHWWDVEFSWMMASLLATNVWNLFDVFRMYWRTQVESVQNIDLVTAMSRSSLRVLFNCTASTAANNSNRGTVIGFRWASRDFPMRNALWMLSFESTILR